MIESASVSNSSLSLYSSYISLLSYSRTLYATNAVVPAPTWSVVDVVFNEFLLIITTDGRTEITVTPAPITPLTSDNAAPTFIPVVVIPVILFVCTPIVPAVVESPTNRVLKFLVLSSLKPIWILTSSPGLNPEIVDLIIESYRNQFQ